MRFNKFILYFLMLFYLVGCASIDVEQSKKVKGFEKKINNLFIVFDGRKMYANIYWVEKEDFHKIVIPFQQQGIKAEEMIFTNLALDPYGDFLQKSKDYDYFLDIKPMWGGEDSVKFGTYNLKLIELKTDYVVWISTIVVNDRRGLYYEHFDMMGEAILAAMEKDNLVKLSKMDDETY